jgi:hypothetical protein
MSSRDEKIVSALFSPFMAPGGRGGASNSHVRPSRLRGLRVSQGQNGTVDLGNPTMAARMLSGAANDQPFC